MKKVLFAPILLFALAIYGLAIEVFDTQIGFTRGNIPLPPWPATVSVNAGGTVWYGMYAKIRNGAGINDAWGCTEAEVLKPDGSPTGVVRYNDHANWWVNSNTTRHLVLGILGGGPTANFAYLKAPVAEGTYDVIFRFYHSGGRNGRCNGAAFQSTKMPGAIVVTGNVAHSPDFSMVHRQTIVGGIKAIGNTAMCVPAGAPNSETLYFNNTEQNCKGLDENGNQIGNHYGKWVMDVEQTNLHYAYVDPDTNKIRAHPSKSRTSAVLNLPPKAKIVYAKLYWMGRLSSYYDRIDNVWANGIVGCSTASSINNNAVKSALNEPKNIVFETPTGKHNITAEMTYLDHYDSQCAYLMSADVSHLIDNDNPSGEYFVADLKSRRSGYAVGTFGGWVLSVIYDNSADTGETHKVAAIYEGWKAGAGRIDASLSGFKTPEVGDVNSTLWYFAGDGDSILHDDRMCINKTTADCPIPTAGSTTDAASNTGGRGATRMLFVFDKATDSPNYNNGGNIIDYNENTSPYSTYVKNRYFMRNPFMSTITTGAVGKGVTPTGSRPAFRDKYTAGFDLHTFELHNYLANDARDTMITFNPVELIVTGAIGFSTMIHSPNLGDIKQEATIVKCDSEIDLRNAVVNYTLTFQNTGDIHAQDVYLEDDFQSNGIMGLIDHTKTSTPILKRNGVDVSTIAGASCAPIIVSGVVVGSQCELPASPSPINAACYKTNSGVDCSIDKILIGETYTVDYNITIKSTIADSDFNRPGGFVNIAQATYYNPFFDPAELVSQPATVVDPVLILKGGCDTLACSGRGVTKPIKTGFDSQSPEDGLYIVYPSSSIGFNPDFDKFKEPFMVYCKNAFNADKDKIEVWLPLPMSMPDHGNGKAGGDGLHPINSNFYFDFSNGSPFKPCTIYWGFNTRRVCYDDIYYHPEHKRAPFPKLINGKTQTGSGSDKKWVWGSAGGEPIYGLRLDMSDLSLHESMYKTEGANKVFEFANINLLGSALAIDKSKSNMGSCNLLWGGEENSQVVKSNLGAARGQRCRASKVVFKQIADYKYEEPKISQNGEMELFFSCRDLKSARKNATNGSYLIDPLGNQGVPLVATCDMPTSSIGQNVSEIITTNFIALDGYSVFKADDMIKDSCIKKGMSFFVPMNKELFAAMQSKLAAKRTSYWSAYTGNLGDWVVQMSGGADSGTGGYYISDLNNRPMWPYGPFGLFKKTSGYSGGAGTKLRWLGESGSNTLHYYGWKTIFDVSAGGTATDTIKNMLDQMKAVDPSLADLELEPTYWISENGCSYWNAYEPNGNYNSYTWLNYVFDANGNVIHCDDSNNGTMFGTGEYSYTNYACIGLDSYFPLDAALPPKVDVWDSTLNIATDPPATFTKLASGFDDVSVKVAPEVGSDVTPFSGYVCARLVSEVQQSNGVSYLSTPPFSPSTPTPATIAGIPADYKCEHIDPAAPVDLRANPLTFTWRANNVVYATQNAFIQVVAFTEACDAYNSECAKESNSSSFSIRPLISMPSSYNPNPKLTAGKQYVDQTLTPVPPAERLPSGLNIVAPIGYKRHAAASSDASCLNGVCLLGIHTNGWGENPPSWVPPFNAKASFSGGRVTPNTANRAEINVSFDDVGELKLRLRDIGWTSVDQGVNYGGSFTSVARWQNDCIPDSSIARIDNVANPPGSVHYGKIGCDIDTPLNSVLLPFAPDRFEFASFETIGKPASSGNQFVYYANAGSSGDAARQEVLNNKTFAQIKIKAIAARFGATGDAAATPSYGYGDDEGNYSKDINGVIAFPAAGTNENDMPTESLSGAWHFFYDPSSSDIFYNGNPNTPKEVWSRGEANITYALNFARDHKTPKPVLFMKARSSSDPRADLNLSLKDEDDITGGAEWTEALAGSTPKKIDFIYGRAHLGDVITKSADANVSYVIDYFSDRTGSEGVRAAFASPSALASSGGWYRIYDPSNPTDPIDNDTNATIEAMFGAAPKTAPNLNNGETYQFDYAAANPRPRRFISHLDIPSYLWYNQFGKDYKAVESPDIGNRRGCFEHPCGTIEFLILDTDGWGGIGKSDDGRHYEDNSTRDRAPIRLGR